MRPITQECVFPINKMGGPISVVFLDIYVFKMEEDIVIPANSIFYQPYVGDAYARRKNNRFKLIPQEH